MKFKKKINFATATLCVLFVISAGTIASVAQKQFAAASALQPEIKVSLTGVVERARGKVALDEVAVVKPGETLEWTIASENTGAGAANGYRTIGQISDGTMLVAGSATASAAATVTYSIDKGRTFSVEPTIEERQADGSVKRVAAPVSMYTQISYDWTDNLASGSKLSASYKVRVK